LRTLRPWNPLLPQLTALRTLKITVGVKEVQPVVFGRAVGKVALKSLKVVMVRFALHGDKHDVVRVKQVQTYVRGTVFMYQFPRLRALSDKGEVSLGFCTCFSERVMRELAALVGGLLPAVASAST
jgi:hypothetical protein